jgi:predicted metal-dependent peptidase
VNAKTLLFNPEFIDSLSMPETKGLLAHEIMHLVYMHNLRGGSRNHEKWNAAGDYVINPVLMDAGFSLPQGGLNMNNPQFKDQTTDHVYNQLPDFPEGGGGTGWSTGVGEVMNDGKGKSESEIHHAEAEMKISIAEAAQAAKAAGKLPAGLERFLDELLDAQIDWREKLRVFINQVARNDYEWSRPNRRFQDVYFPRMHSEEAGKITVAIDTSGSISQNEIQHFFSELNAIVDEVRPVELDIIDIDSSIKQVHTYTSDEYPIDWRELKLKGGGGTSFSPVFEHYRHAENPPVCLIYLTDLYCSNFGDEPEFPVLWVSTSNIKEVPFGEVTKLDV